MLDGRFDRHPPRRSSRSGWVRRAAYHRPGRPRACHRCRLRSRRRRACRRASLAAPSPPIVSPPSDPITNSTASIVFCPAPTSVAARLTAWDTADRLVLIDAQAGPRCVLLDEATRKLLDELAASASGGGIPAEIGVGSSSRCQSTGAGSSPETWPLSRRMRDCATTDLRMPRSHEQVEPASSGMRARTTDAPVPPAAMLSRQDDPELGLLSGVPWRSREGCVECFGGWA